MYMYLPLSYTNDYVHREYGNYCYEIVDFVYEWLDLGLSYV